MTELQIGDQLIQFDRAATVSAYAQLEHGGADVCTCSACCNFARVRDKAYPETFRTLLDQMGIDANKEGEAVHYAPSGNQHVYGGWFYFVGKLIEPGQKTKKSLVGFQHWVGTNLPRPPGAFGKEVAGLEFITLLPWVLEEPYDPAKDTS